MPPPAIFWIWNRFADAHKAKNLIAVSMISTTVRAHFELWHLGATLFQATGGGNQLRLRRLAGERRGARGGCGSLIFYYSQFDRETLALSGIAIAAFLLPFLTFTNLYINHNYYFTENSIFVIFAVAVVIGRLYS